MAARDDRYEKLYDRFDLVFCVTVVTVALLLLVDLDEEGLAEILSLAVTVLTATMLFLAVTAAGVGRRGRRIALIIGAVGALTGLASLLFTSVESGFGGVAWLLLVVAAPVVASRRIMEHDRVTSATILGALSVFLMLAVAATYLFLFIDTFLSGSGHFFGTAEPTTVYAYFSFVTITSTGYGDFYPIGVFGRAAAVWEAVIGQIYLVVVVARLVSLYSGGRFFPRRSGSAGDD